MKQKHLSGLLQKFVEFKVVLESKSHTEFGYLVALSNIIKELSDNYQDNSFLQTWIKYRTHIWKTNILRNYPYFMKNFEVVQGLEYLLDHIEEGGLLVTFHYGDYRHGVIEVAKQMYSFNANIDFKMIVDQESYNTEKQLDGWKRLTTKYNISYLIAESPASALVLGKHMRKGGWGILYLDGNTGAGQDTFPLEIDFVNSKIQLRSGIFRLMKMTKKPLYPVIADYTEDGRSRLTVHPPIVLKGKEIQEMADQSLDHLRRALLYKPELWRFWFRHHRQVIQWPETIESSAQREIKYRSKERTGSYGIDIGTGDIYTI